MGWVSTEADLKTKGTLEASGLGGLPSLHIPQTYSWDEFPNITWNELNLSGCSVVFSRNLKTIIFIFLILLLCERESCGCMCPRSHLSLFHHWFGDSSGCQET